MTAQERVHCTDRLLVKEEHAAGETGHSVRVTRVMRSVMSVCGFHTLLLQVPG